MGSRRAFLFGAGSSVEDGEIKEGSLNKVVEAADNPQLFLHSQRRPPGALPEPQFMDRCSRCGDCVSACPHQAVFLFNTDQGDLANTPVMMPDKRACHLCEELPCVVACTTGALRVPSMKGADTLAQASSMSSGSGVAPDPIGPGVDLDQLRLGTVRINEAQCFAFKGPECGACVGVCPRDISAIASVRWRPQLNAAMCVGCGLCIEACPTDPKAITLLPLARFE